MGDDFASRPPQIEKLYEGDPHLRHHESDLLLRWNRMMKVESAIISSEGGLADFAESYRHYGIVQMENGDVEVLATIVLRRAMQFVAVVTCQ